MPDPSFVLVAASTDSGVAGIEAVSRDIAQLPLLQHLSEVLPAADLLLGGAMLIVIMLVHAAGVRATTNHVLRRSTVLLQRPTRLHADLLMSGTVFALLTLHLVEMFAWAAALVNSGLVPDWRTAGFFAGNTYTTIGYGNFVLPDGWKMLAPIIAISGLFTFGWSAACSWISSDAARRSRMRRQAPPERRGAGARPVNPRRPSRFSARRIHAVAQPAGRRSIRKHVAQMRVARTLQMASTLVIPWRSSIR